MQFIVTCEITVNEKQLSNVLTAVTSVDGKIKSVQPLEEEPQPTLHVVQDDEPAQVVEDVRYDRLSKHELYSLIVTHARIGTAKTAMEWGNFIGEKTDKHFNPKTVKSCLYLFADLGLMRRPSRGFYILDAVLPIESASAMLKKHETKHREKYGRSKPTKATRLGLNLFNAS